MPNQRKPNNIFHLIIDSIFGDYAPKWSINRYKNTIKIASTAAAQNSEENLWICSDRFRIRVLHLTRVTKNGKVRHLFSCGWDESSSKSVVGE
jgi:hypothetical protein